MNRIYKYLTSAAAALACLAACEEFQPVFTGTYPAPEPWKIYSDADFDFDGDGNGDFISIEELVKVYMDADFEYVNEKGETKKKTVGDGQPVKVEQDVVVKGIVTTNDQPGNFYKSLYIQDETGGIEVKIGKNGLYNDYKQGQIIYIKCSGLYLGMYGYKGGTYGGNGMVSIGYDKDTDDPDKYENSSLDDTGLINSHVFRGAMADKGIEPVVITSTSELPEKTAMQGGGSSLGKLVTIKGLSYANETFTLMYLDPNKSHDEDANRVFLSRTLNAPAGDWSWGVKTWALKKERMIAHLKAGDWDECSANGGGKVGDEKNKSLLLKNAMPYSVSQYFTLPGMDVSTSGDEAIQIRTSGFCKFADEEIDADVLAGTKKLDVTGILSLYQGKRQLTLISLDGVKIVE